LLVARAMRRFVVGFAVFILTAPVAAVTACDDESDCCPVSESFMCSNFDVGGSRSLNGGFCETGLADDISQMTGKKVDAKGCTYWERDPNGGITCSAGARPRDAGSDTSVIDATSMDSSDASNAGDAGDATID
jgi:hypothetical protein